VSVAVTDGTLMKNDPAVTIDRTSSYAIGAARFDTPEPNSACLPVSVVSVASETLREVARLMSGQEGALE